ncbi:MAG TPA: hypothetical protein VIF32_05185 [Gemmatimonadaceae bacterium]
MPHRQFRDTAGSVWDVWDVYPTAIERRYNERRNGRRRKSERRTRNESRAVGVPSDLRMGWLAFQAGRERRRLVPIPPDWISLPEDQLRILKERATRSERLR